MKFNVVENINLHTIKHNITPRTIIKKIQDDIVSQEYQEDPKRTLISQTVLIQYIQSLTPMDKEKVIKKLEREMKNMQKI